MFAITATTRDKMLLTIAAVSLVNFQPASAKPLNQIYMPVNSTTGAHFKPSHILVDNKLIELPYGLSQGVSSLSSLIEIGNFCLAGSRDITAEESALVHTQIRKKYKRIQ